MPNHVKNVLTFKKLKKKDINAIVDIIAVKAEPYAEDGDLDKGYRIDFNKIIPEPQTLEECPEDCRVNKDSHVEEDKDRPWFDWYKWRNRYWGTKWGAYDCYSIIEDNSITFVFSTAWSMPYPIIERLCLLGYEFELKYADEDLGSNCGTLYYERDDETGEMERYESSEDEQFAEELWENY